MTHVTTMAMSTTTGHHPATENQTRRPTAITTAKTAPPIITGRNLFTSSAPFRRTHDWCVGADWSATRLRRRIEQEVCHLMMDQLPVMSGTVVARNHGIIIRRASRAVGFGVAQLDYLTGGDTRREKDAM